MKARIKATGEIAEFSTGKNLQGETILLKVGTASIFSLNEVEPIADIDWQQVRIQASIAAMQGLISGGIYTSSTIRLAKERGQSGTEFIAQMATEFADDLIAELQKKGGQDD